MGQCRSLTRGAGGATRIENRASARLCCSVMRHRTGESVKGPSERRGRRQVQEGDPARRRELQKPSRAPAVNRAAAILELVAAQGDVPIGVTAVARALGLPKASAVNLCNALDDVGFLRRRNGGFVLGARLVSLSAAYLSSLDVTQEFHAACEKCDESRDETIQLAVLSDGLTVVYVARRMGRRPVRLVSEIGRQLPANCTATGKVLLASLPPESVLERIPTDGRLPTLTASSIATPDELLQELAQVRARGYAIDAEETAEGAVCIAVALPAPVNEEPPAAVGITVASGVLKARVDELAGLAREIRDELARRLGV